MSQLDQLSIQIYADGAEKEGMIALYNDPLIKGLTTNPTLMRKANVADYEGFARDILETITDKPISFEVFSDEFDEMARQATKIQSWGENVFVKIPITNTKRESALPLIAELAKEGVQLNVTAILTLEQVEGVAQALRADLASVVSIFAGRIADTGIDPIPVMERSQEILTGLPKAELLWASTREVLNIFQADACGCDIITVTFPILEKAQKLAGMDLGDLSLDTVKSFYQDAAACGYTIA